MSKKKQKLYFTIDNSSTIRTLKYESHPQVYQFIINKMAEITDMHQKMTQKARKQGQTVTYELDANSFAIVNSETKAKSRVHIYADLSKRKSIVILDRQRFKIDRPLLKKV